MSGVLVPQAVRLVNAVNAVSVVSKVSLQKSADKPRVRMSECRMDEIKAIEMEEREFNKLADAMMARIEQALEQCGLDVDYELMSGGIMEIEFMGTGGKIVINRHTAAQEIWVAARSGGFHFSPDPARPGRWLGTRDGAELLSVLSRCMSEQSGTSVTLG